MKIAPFELERYFAKYEFSVEHLLCCSDCEPLGMQELVSMADEETRTMWENLTLGYTESDGLPALRQQIAALYSNMAREDVFVAAPEELIFILMNTLLEKEDHVVTTYPAYQSLYQVALSTGCTVSKWMPEYGNDGFRFDVEQLKDLLCDKTRLIVINFPHNPTGALPDGDEIRAVVELARERGIYIFSDEMYRYLEHPGTERIASVCDLYEKGISLSGMSKSFSLAGLRIGWLATSDREILGEAACFKDYTTICNSAPSEILALMGLRSKERIVSGNLELIRGNLDLLDEFFQIHETLFEWKKPNAGSVAFPGLKLKKGAADFCSGLLAEKGVLLLPSRVYGSEWQGENVRIGFGRRNMQEGLERLDVYIRENL
ncbi:MAG: aminotransferase class I/II-fold pyridoxal phosphate-dependent enzyme [Desulfarculaceae bacterium]|nr:aminotransferase class I/II-fold pyridoxal phosphate-dependent enzyme [Desulfarculaceae bacterium]